MDSKTILDKLQATAYFSADKRAYYNGKLKVWLCIRPNAVFFRYYWLVDDPYTLNTNGKNWQEWTSSEVIKALDKLLV